jgi:hypothetical protein
VLRVSLLCALTGCSLIFTPGKPDFTIGHRPAPCLPIAPVGDVAIGVISFVPLTRYVRDRDYGGGALIAFGAAIEGAVFLASAVYGFVKYADCAFVSKQSPD